MGSRSYESGVLRIDTNQISRFFYCLRLPSDRQAEGVEGDG